MLRHHLPKAPRPHRAMALVRAHPLSLVTVLIVLVGLGLAVVARIIEQLGGQLRVDSKPNEGSRFSLLIPFGMCSQSGSSTSSRSRSDSLRGDEIESLVHALQSHQLTGITSPRRDVGSPGADKVEPSASSHSKLLSPDNSTPSKKFNRSRAHSNNCHDTGPAAQLRILIVEVS